MCNVLYVLSSSNKNRPQILIDTQKALGERYRIIETYSLEKAKKLITCEVYDVVIVEVLCDKDPNNAFVLGGLTGETPIIAVKETGAFYVVRAPYRTEDLPTVLGSMVGKVQEITNDFLENMGKVSVEPELVDNLRASAISLEAAREELRCLQTKTAKAATA